MIPKEFEKFKLTINVWKEKEWIAECKEFGILTQGNSLPEVLRNIGEMCAIQIEYAEEHDNWNYFHGTLTTKE